MAPAVPGGAAAEPPRLHLVERVPVDWEQAYRVHVVTVYRFVYSRCGNRPDAEDLTTQTFLRALPRLDAAATEPQQRAYLLTAARTVLADHWAAHYAARWDELDDRIAGEAGEPEADRTLDIEAVLAPLPAHYRTVLELRFLRGYSVRETASAMGITVANAKVMQLRALRAAARCSEEEAR